MLALTHPRLTATRLCAPQVRVCKMTAMPRKNPHAVALGRKGGLKGGKARWEGVPPEQRREIARKAARARWKKER